MSQQEQKQKSLPVDCKDNIPNIAAPGIVKNVVFMLCQHADNDTGECWPSIANLSRETSFSRSSVERALVWLKRHRLIKTVSGKKKGTINKYFLQPVAKWKVKWNTKKRVRQRDGGVRHADGGVRQTDVQNSPNNSPMNSLNNSLGNGSANAEPREDSVGERKAEPGSKPSSTPHSERQSVSELDQGRTKAEKVEKPGSNGNPDYERLASEFEALIKLPVPRPAAYRKIKQSVEEHTWEVVWGTWKHFQQNPKRNYAGEVADFGGKRRVTSISFLLDIYLPHCLKEKADREAAEKRRDEEEREFTESHMNRNELMALEAKRKLTQKGKERLEQLNRIEEERAANPNPPSLMEMLKVKMAEKRNAKLGTGISLDGTARYTNGGIYSQNGGAPCG